MFFLFYIYINVCIDQAIYVFIKIDCFPKSLPLKGGSRISRSCQIHGVIQNGWNSVGLTLGYL